MGRRDDITVSAYVVRSMDKFIVTPEKVVHERAKGVRGAVIVAAYAVAVRGGKQIGNVVMLRDELKKKLPGCMKIAAFINAAKAVVMSRLTRRVLAGQVK